MATLGTGSTVLATLMPELTDTANIQTAMKQLYYGTSDGTLSNSTGIYGALYTLFTGNPTLAGSVTITGDLTVSGTTTTLDVTNLLVEDKEIVIGNVASPSNTTANGGGIRLAAGLDVDKTIIWDSTNANWTTSENWNIAAGKTLKIGNTDIASGTGAALILGANASTSLALGNTSGTTTLNGTISVTNPNRTMAHLMGYTSTVTSGTTYPLSNTSSYYQQFTGSTAQTVTLPATSTLAQGWTFHIVNNNTPTGDLTVNSSGGNLVITVPPGTTAMVTCILNSGTTAASWEAGLTDFSTYTGTGNVVLATSPTIDVINAASATGTTQTLFSNTSTGTINIGGSSFTTGSIILGGSGTGTIQLGGTAVGSSGTINILTGSTTSGIKTINIGTNGSTGSTTTINIGTTNGTTPTITLNGTVNTTSGSFKVGNTTLVQGVTGNITFPATVGTLIANPMTLAGSIIYGGASGVPAALGPTTNNGWVLTYDTSLNAPKWAVSSGGSGSLGYVGSYQTTVSANTVNANLADINQIIGASGNTTGNLNIAAYGSSSLYGHIYIGGTLTTSSANISNPDFKYGGVSIAGMDNSNSTAGAYAGPVFISGGRATGTANLGGSVYIDGGDSFNSTAGTVNIGTLSLSSGAVTPNINIGTASSITSIAGTVNVGGASGTVTVGSTQITGNTVYINNAATTSSNTKVVNIGTGGASGSITNISLGSATSGATGTTKLTTGLSVATPSTSTITGTTYTMGVNDTVLVFNTTAACTVTMLSAATYPGKVVWVKQIAAFAVSSSSSTSNLGVQPLTSTTAGTAILSGAGKFAQLVSNGTNWVIMNAN